MKRIISLLLFILVLTGCSLFPTEPILQPEGKVIVNGEQYKMISDEYEWKEGNVEITTGSSDINELVENFETLDIKKGDTLKFEIDKNPSSTTVIKLNEDGTSDTVEIKNNKIKMPSENGYYIYQLTSVWPQGRETFVFDVNVK